MDKKKCYACQELKDKTEFNRDRSKPGGFEYRCKECAKSRNRAYRRTRAGKATYLRYNNSELGRLTAQRYARSEYGARRNRERSALKRELHPERVKAINAVNNEVRAKRMPRADELECTHRGERCKIQAREYHHWSYDSGHWLDVIPVCKPCHIEIDKQRTVSL